MLRRASVTTGSRLASRHLMLGSQRIVSGLMKPSRLSSLGMRMNLRYLCSKVGDTVTVSVPSLGDSVSEGAIASVMKEVGSSVEADEVVLVIETDKVSSDVRTTHPGVVSEVMVEEGDVVNVGDPLFAVTVGEAAAKAAPKAAKTAETPVAEAPKAAAPAPAKAAKPAAPTPPKVAPTPGSRGERRVAMTRMRLKISERLKESQNTAASLTTFNEIDMSGIMAVRNKYKDAFLKKNGVKLGFMSIFVKAATQALLEFPAVNAVVDGKDIIYRDYVDMSVAVATPTGLVVPVLRNTENMSFAQIEAEIMSLAERARDVLQLLS